MKQNDAVETLLYFGATVFNKYNGKMDVVYENII